jgi:hypothetical protein
MPTIQRKGRGENMNKVNREKIKVKSKFCTVKIINKVGAQNLEPLLCLLF